MTTASVSLAATAILRIYTFMITSNHASVSNYILQELVAQELTI